MSEKEINSQEILEHAIQESIKDLKRIADLCRKLTDEAREALEKYLKHIRLKYIYTRPKRARPEQVKLTVLLLDKRSKVHRCRNAC